MGKTASQPSSPEVDKPRAVAGGRRSRWRIVLELAIVAYAVSIVALWAWMYWDGDREWLATLVLFGPRWLCATPLPLLALAAAIFRRRMLLPLAATAIVILGPIMGFQFHLPPPASAKASLKVMTCNVDQYEFRIESLADLIEREQPDVVALQEIRYDSRFVWPAGWHVIMYNEFILASRWPIFKTDHALRTLGDFAGIRFVVQAPDREFQVFNIHLSTPRPGLEAVLNRRTLINFSAAGELEKVLRERATEAARVSDWIAEYGGSKIVMGDFNTPCDSTIFRRNFSSLRDAFSSVGWGLGFTKISEKDGWSYGARIDHVLFNADWHCLRCWVGPDIGSDHLPLLAEFE